MAYIVRRGDRGYELRESRSTPSGPRSRTLATFRVLTDEVVTHAVARAARPLDRARIRALAAAAGAPVGGSVVDVAARIVLEEAAAGRPPSPVLRARLVDALQHGVGYQPAAGHAGGPADWAQASMAERGEALKELLDLADRLPQRRPGPLAFPPMAPLPRREPTT